MTLPATSSSLPPPRLRRIAWMLTAFYATFHFVMTHIPPGSMPAPRVSDKTLHFLSYGVLTGCLYLAIWLGGASVARAAALVLVITAVFGTFDELLQAPVGRSPELLDWLVDLAAAVVTVACFSTLRLLLPKTTAAAPVPTPSDD